MPLGKILVVFLRKTNGICDFIERCFVHYTLMWWNGDARNGNLSHRFTPTRARNFDALDLLKQTSSMDGEQVDDGSQGISIHTS
jgi:hypothetical protein